MSAETPQGAEWAHGSDWARDAVFYAIYPLGLLGAPRRNDFGATPVERLAGLDGWLDHARSLGCTAVYLGPVFESTAHGYDTADFWHVDRRLGTDESLERLVGRAHEIGLRVALDGVFNHVGRDFWAFRDVREKGETSAFRGWFAGLRFESEGGGRSPFGDPFTYEGWHGHFDLVKLDLSNPDVRNHVLAAVRSWIVDFGIDGLRIDAADVVSIDFLRELSSFCREIEPDFWLFGEVVHGDYRHWIRDGGLDSVTNYECYKGLWSSLADRNYFEIAYALERQFGERGLYRDLPLFNFADNHDQDRVASRLAAGGGGAAPAGGRAAGRLLYPLYLLLFTMPGVPSIYYGSEWGLDGRRGHGDDGPVRPALDLVAARASAPEPGLEAAIQRLAEVRRGSVALRRGGYRQLFVAPEQLAFERVAADGERVVVMLNAAAAPTVVSVAAVDGEWRDLLSGESFVAAGGRLSVEVPPSWGRVLRKS